MKNNKRRILLFGIFIFLGLMFAAAACTPEPQQETPSSTEPIVLPVDETEELLPPEGPTITPGMPTVILASGGEEDTFIFSRTQSILENLAGEDGLILEIQEALTSEEITSNAAVVVGVGPNLDLNGLAASSPEVQFVAVGNPNAVPASNLSVIGDPIGDLQGQSFMAGYLTALISTDYKVGGLIASDNETREMVSDSFVVGVRFFCGICQPKYPPYNRFPQLEGLATENAENGFQAVVDALAISGVEVLFVHHPLATDAMVSYLGEQGIKIVSDGSPTMARNNWVGTVQIDPGPVLIEIWPDIRSGVAGMLYPSAFTLTDTSAGLISEGRLQLFEVMAADLRSGLVLPESVP